MRPESNFLAVQNVILLKNGQSSGRHQAIFRRPPITKWRWPSPIYKPAFSKRTDATILRDDADAYAQGCLGIRVETWRCVVAFFYDWIPPYSPVLCGLMAIARLWRKPVDKTLKNQQDDPAK